MSRGAKHGPLCISPFAIPIFWRLRRVEILHPVRQIVAVVGGGDPLATLRLDPVGGIGGESTRENGAAIFHGNSEHTRLPLRRELEFIANSVGEQVVRRSSRLIWIHSNLLCGVVLDRGDHFLLLWVPPFIGCDAVAVAVSAGE